MNATAYFNHLEKLHSVFPKLEPIQAFAFGAACTERQWPVYARAAAGKVWSRETILRRSLDKVWDWLLRRRGRPEGLAFECERAILEEIEDDIAQAASEVATSMYGLAKAIEADAPADCLYVADSGLRLIDSFLYELLGLPISSDNDRIVHSHELMGIEIKRQQEDLAILLRGTLFPATIEELRSRSNGASVLGEYWYYDVPPHS